MLQRDYIQRLIREFMAALERMLEKKEVEVRREKIKELYNQYVGPYAFYSIATIEDVMKAMAGIDDEEKRLSKMDMLAELYYHEADMVGQPTRDELLSQFRISYAVFCLKKNLLNLYRRRSLIMYVTVFT